MQLCKSDAKLRKISVKPCSKPGYLRSPALICGAVAPFEMQRQARRRGKRDVPIPRASGIL
jgi:hypothetical protein